MDAPITRHLVTITGQWGTRQVHYRRAGSGPTVLLLHQSPQSSREYVPLMQEWSRQFTLIAPDTPGYGLSDPLGVDEASMEDFAAATLEMADAIGLGRFGVYGFHTGGSMGIALAHAHPNRICAVATNGLVVLNEQELDDILTHYLPAFEPRWDGSHLTWLWSRLREQTVFFPWYRHTLEARMDFDMPDPENLQKNVREFLCAGDHYRVAYRAAFSYDPRPVVTQLEVPVSITAAANDPLADHLGRIESCADCVGIVLSADFAETLNRSLQHLLNYPGESAPEPGRPDPIEDRAWNDVINTPSGAVRLRRRSGLGDTTTVVLHGAGGSSETVDKLGGALTANGPVIALDLPGHGESDVACADGDVADWASAVIATLDALDLAAVDLVGEHAGAVVAMEVLCQAPRRIHRLSLLDLPLLTESQHDACRRHGTPALDPVWHGGHLLLAWHMVRDGRLFFPWFQKDRQGIRWIEADLNPETINLEVREVLVANGYWQRLLQAQLDYPVKKRLAELQVSTALCATQSSPYRDILEDAAGLADSLEFVSLPTNPAAWTAVFQGRH